MNEGTASGIYVESLKVGVSSDVYKLVVPEDYYLVMQYGGKTKDGSELYDHLTSKLSLYSDINLTKLVLDKKIDEYGSACFTTIDKINKGTYYVQFLRYNGSFSANTVSLFAYFGYLPLNTEFFSVDFVKSENNGKNITLKLNTLDTLSNMVIADSNGPGGAGYSTISVVGREYKVDENGCFSVGINQNDSGYCYFEFGVKDIYGNKFSNWYGVITDYTTTVTGIPSTVEYTGKPITLKDLKVITGYKHSSCATYDVQYENNTNVGTAKVTITGNGNFIGSVTKTFKIVHTKHSNVTKIIKKPTYFSRGTKSTTCSICDKVGSASIPKLTLKTPSFTVKGGRKQIEVTYKKIKDATGYQIKYKIGKKTVIKTYKSAKAASRKINKLKKGAYSVQVRSMITKNKLNAYSNWSKVKTIKIK